MPIQDKGYRHYEGPRRGRFWRAPTIAACGIRLALARKRLTAMVLLGVTPAIVIGVLIYYSTQGEEFVRQAAGLMDTVEEWKNDLGENPTMARIWNTIFQVFFSIQVFPVAVIVTFVGPDLISRDLRHRAFQVYYARPLTRVDYLLGKLAVIAVFVGIVTVVPALLLYVVGVVLSRDIAIIPQTWSTPVGIVGAYALTAFVVGSIVLMCSTFTRRAGYAALAWSAIVILSDAGYALLREILAPKWGYVISLRANVLQLTAAALRVKLPYEGDWFRSFAVLTLTVVVAWAVLIRRAGALEGEH